MRLGVVSANIQGIIPVDLVTTAQTSGCLIVLYYNNSSGKESISILPQNELQAV